ncbi:MAG: hypothetical protein WA151_11360 [Desulfatirhabdiaceae bacterium]
MIDYNKFSAREMVLYIDKQFGAAKLKRISRLSEEWGAWSREMNLVLRKRVECGDAVSKLIFSYWMAHSKLLELHHKSHLLVMIKQGKLLKEITTIKKSLLLYKI